MQTVVQRKTRPRHSMTLVRRENVHSLPAREQKNFDEAFGFSNLTNNSMKNFTYQIKRRCI